MQLKTRLIIFSFLFSLIAKAGDSTIILSPVINGDSWPELQQASDYAAIHAATILLNRGDFHISRPWMLAQINLNGRDYNQVTYNIIGAQYAYNAQPAYTSNIIADFTDVPAVIMQLNKGTNIENITISGQYTFPLSLNQLQVDTLTFDQWNDHKCADNRTAPYTGVCIDPFSDPSHFQSDYFPMYPGLDKYYIPGMGRGGSTGIIIHGCAITQFVVGVLITGGWQYNGECIKLVNNKIQDCKVEYAYSQAQSKANVLENTLVWGNTHTIVDGVNYGFTHSDASTAPFVSVMNIAGAAHQIMNIYASTFPASFSKIYGEGVYKIGIVRGLVGTHFEDFQIDFGNSGEGYPSPDFYYAGYNTTWTNCMLRLYNTTATRIVMDFPANTFIGGSMNAPPVQWNTSAGGTTPNLAQFNNVGMFYYWTKSGVLSANNYESRAYIDGDDTLHINRSDFSGWFRARNMSGLKVGDIIVTTKQFGDQFATIQGSNYPVGFIRALGQGIVYLKNMGVGFHEGDRVATVRYTIKPL